MGERKKAVAVTIVGVALLVVSCGGQATPTATTQPAELPTEVTKPIRIAAVFVGPATVGAWNNSIYTTLQDLNERDDLEIITAENVDYAKATELIREYGGEGYDLVLGTSAGFEAALREVAPEYPNTFFINYSDISTTDGLPNLAGFKLQYQEVGYLMGMTAGLLTKTDTIGGIGAVPIPAVNVMLGGAVDGVEAVNPDARILVAFTQNWIDLVKGKEIALAQISDGADVLVDFAGPGGDGAIQAACEKGVFITGYVVDENSLCPDRVVVSWIADHRKAITTVINQFAAGEVEPAIHPLNIANGGLSISPFYNVPEDVKAQVVGAYEAIKSGELVIEPHPYEE